MTITQTQRGPWTILHLQGRLDEAGAKTLKDRLPPLLQGGWLALDFAETEYVTSSGFRVLMVAAKEQKAKRGRLLMGNMRDSLRQFFDLAGLGPIFGIVDRLEPAMDAESVL